MLMLSLMYAEYKKFKDFRRKNNFSRKKSNFICYLETKS